MRDLRSAVRALVATPIVSAVAVISLALGIGACTALFTIFDSLLLRSLPVQQPAGLAALHDSIGNSFWSNPLWEQVRRRAELFAGAAASSSTLRFNASPSGEADFVEGLYVSGGFFEVLGVPAVVGRVIDDRDDRRGGGSDGAVAVLSHAFWQRRFGGAVDVVGRKLTLDHVPFTIVGVAPPGFFGVAVGAAFDVAVPLGTEALMRGARSMLDRPNSSWLNVIVRLKPGQAVEQATSAIHATQPQIREATMPGNLPAAAAARYLTRPLQFQPAANGLTGPMRLGTRYRQPILLLLGAGGLLLLVACANIANVGLARAAARSHELAVRAALGASKVSLARPLFLESLLVSGAGALLGLGLSRLGAHALVSGLSTSVSRTALDLPTDWRVLAFTAGAATVATTVFGVGPALRAAAARPQEALAFGGRGTTGTGRPGVSGALVVVQVALALVLVVLAGVFGRSLGALWGLDPGFDRDPVLTVVFEKLPSGTDAGLPDAVLDRVVNAARVVPGVRLAAASFVTPVHGQSSGCSVEVVGEPPPRDHEALRNVVSPGWFATYGTAVVAGRDFSDADVPGAPVVALVNRAFVKRFLPGKDPLGRLILEDRSHDGDPARAATIVGVVEDAAYRTLRERPTPTLYFAYAQRGPNRFFATSLSIRSAGPPVTTLVRPLVAALKAAAPHLSFAIRPLEDQVNATIVRERLMAKVSGFFGGFALLLATLGLYGTTAYNVGRRRGEIGIRLALGGTPGVVLRLVLGRLAWLVGAGLAAGAVASYWAARFVKTLVFGVEPRDPATLAVAVLVLTAAALTAAWVPARRACRVNPTILVREA